jgi:hypothetical protein
MADASLQQGVPYPARLRIDYPERLDRVTTLLRIVWTIPIVIILALVTDSGGGTVTIGEQGQRIRDSGGSIVFSIGFATALMIVFRERYPRWFDFQLALARFTVRVFSYLALLRDEYPSTEDEQSVHLELDYPDARRDLARGLPLVKWLLAIPHYIVLFVLFVFAFVAVVVAWFAILFTGRYPRALFDFVVGVGRWALRVEAYALLLITDRYPPFSLD